MSETGRQWEGQIIAGKFELRAYLGGSEQGCVFEAERQGQQVAIKLIHANETQARNHLLRWAQTASLSHPHLVRLFETGRCRIGDADLVYVVMERADEALAEILPQRALTPAEAGEMLPPIVAALAYLHGQGFAHGSIQPSNILAVGEHVKISSDGICPIGAQQNRSSAYDAPELSGTGCSAAADVWSLGLILSQALTQQIPRWQESSGADSTFLEAVPQPFLDIVHNCLRRDPQSRWTAGDILARLQLSHRPPAMHPEAALQVPPARAPKNSSRLVPATVLIVLVGMIVLAIGKIRDRSQNRQDEVAVREPTPAAGEKTHKTASLSPHEAITAGTERPDAAPTDKSLSLSEPKQSATPSPAASADAASAFAESSAASDQATERVIPEVPQKARDTIHGTVKVGIRVDVDPSGQVTAVSIDSPGPSRYFANLAAGAARRWTFVPARADDGMTHRVWILRFEFAQAATKVFATRLRQ